MLIQGSTRTNRTQKLALEYTKLLEQGIAASKILVLIQNSFKKNIFTTLVRQNLNIPHFEEPKIHTFYGLAYNTIMNFWPLLQDSINFGENVVTPNLTGLEISQFFFKKAIKEVGFNDYNSKINLIHQLFRRYSLIVNNSLSDKEVQEKSDILKESFAQDAKSAIELYKKQTLEYRAFDYLRQVDIFSHLYKTTDCFKEVEYLILDDADEVSPLEFEFLRHIKPQLKEVFIGYDRHGSCRLGFLNTDINTVKNIEECFKDEPLENLDEIKNRNIQAEILTFSRRPEMLEQALEKIQSLLNSGVSPDEISIITPIIDSSLKFAVSENFDSKNIKYKYFSGSEKLYNTPIVKDTITLLNMSCGVETDVYKIRGAINNLLKIPVKYCMAIVTGFNNTSDIKLVDLGSEKYNEQLKLFIETIEKIRKENLTLSEKIFIIFDCLINPNFDELEQLEAFNFFVKQVQDFENVFPAHKNSIAFQKAVILQLENSIISENPSFAPETDSKSIIIATAQKIIDFSISTKYQFWLDISSNAWVREDFGTLYNGWVFQKSWDKEEFTYEDNIEYSSLKTKKVLRKLSLLCNDRIFAYSSLFDTDGNENFGGIEEYLTIKKEKQPQAALEFTPRDDQKPILEYKKGSMAISAVPGAGKTTILLALIIKLLNSGVKSENIFVMTYMDSAARNFKERIQKVCPDLEKMPNISTIHGLALRILKENANYVKAGLDADFEVCDDNLRQKILREIMAKLQLEQDDFDKFEKAVSALKLSSPLRQESKDPEIQKFLRLYRYYNRYLKNRNIIDYDDMLSYCVKILEENKDIREYYQDLCSYVIEDEAQDSSEIQQKLLNILSGRHKNIIRCGDINQAITSTFTSADMEGFTKFVKNSFNVEMNRSQRCSKAVYTLANRLIDFSKSKQEYKKAFFNIKMQEVPGKNPVTENGLTVKTFESYTEENSYILEEIRKIFKTNPSASVAILVRNNYKIEEYSQFLGNYGYNVITLNDCLDNQPVFSLIFSILNFCAHPWQNEKIIATAEILKKQKLLKLSTEDIDYIKELQTPFIMENQDSAISSSITQLLWDLNYWLENSVLPVEELALKIGNYYFNTGVERANIYIISGLIKKMSALYKTNEVLLERIAELSKKPVMNKFKFFTEEDTQDRRESSIRIMTFHKSKGDEFDYVFIPGLSEEILPLELKNIKIKSKERFIEAVKALNLNYNKKDEKSMQLFTAGENLRLFYVAITRAKKKLFVTCANKYKKFSRLKDIQKSILFDELLNRNPSGETHAG